MTKQQAIEKINKTPIVYLNDDQKNVARGIINSIPKGEDVLSYFDFIMKRTDVGFKFDVAPEIAIGRLAVVNEMEKLNINVDENVDFNENKLIIGDNYEALKNLLLTYKEKIDVIYIDPPYNTEKSREDGNTSAKEGEASKFIYKDKFGRNGWLNMMRDRLILAKKLLSPFGVIFVSIDDVEQAYLKVLMDEIFEEKNFLNQLSWVSNKKGRQISNSPFAKTYEYILMYSKNEIEHFPYAIYDRDEAEKEMPSIYKPKNIDVLEDKHGKFIFQNELHNTNINDFNINTRRNLYYPIYTNGKKITTKFTKGYQELLPPKNSLDLQGVWRWSKDKIEKESFNLHIKEVNEKYKIYTKVRNLSYTPKDLILSSSMTTKSGSNDLSKLDILKFSFPKPVALIKFLLKMTTSQNALILDFFAGSGTTGHAVLELNKEDNGHRKFILVTNNENNIALDVTYERLHRIIVGKDRKGQSEFKWIKKNDPYIAASLRIFNIKHYDVETNQSEKLDDITSFAVSNLKKLNPLYKPNNLQVYYDLDGLNPLNEAQKRQIYSTDKVIHEECSKIVDNKFYCTCGKSFQAHEELQVHFKKRNNN